MTSKVVLRIPERTYLDLAALLSRRFPTEEWATFARIAWREIEGQLILLLNRLEPPMQGDLDESVSHVSFQEPYSLRQALALDAHPFAVCVVHSHPVDYAPKPSRIDDDMDRYYSGYFASFAPDRPYTSLIYSVVDGEQLLSGRVWWRGRWMNIERVLVDGLRIYSSALEGDAQRQAFKEPRSSRARLSSAFGIDADRRLQEARVAVIGAGGTGSAAIEALARAGVGEIVIVDPDTLEDSNLERVHGSVPADSKAARSKVRVALDHVRAIDPSIRVVGIEGRIPQDMVIDEIVSANIVLSCTDSHSSRLAVSDVAFRYLVPVLDCAVTLEGSSGTVRGQIMQFSRFLPNEPCALCRRMIDPRRVQQELMSASERVARQQAADAAEREGRRADAYWQAERQLNTVGYLTTAAGALVAGYAIGMITGRFNPPFSRLQLNVSAPEFEPVEVQSARVEDCVCASSFGAGAQQQATRLITAPTHWPPAHRSG